ncbi:MAG TPA: sigma-70 family RNA polymerase sigma factor [Allosphingosinicella sp.]|nr:sigma-70 family RNA polymerase sigma factor [Allosphingosinicella sp.]
MMPNTARILDEYLLASARAGDHKASGLLARRWQKKLLAHAWRLLGDGEAARDAVQEGWVEILRGLPRLNDERAFPAWAYRIVSRRCARQIGSEVRQRRLAEAIEPAPPGENEAGAELDRERLRAAVRALPPEQRAAVALFYFEELSVAEVAVALDVPAGTVKTRLMHARRKLSAALGQGEG